MSNLFNKSDFESKDGMLTSVWGPSMWHFLHTMSFNYPLKPTKQDKDNYHNFLMSLQKILPCKYCRDNYNNNLKGAKYSRRVLKNRETFSKFIYNLHDNVNKMLGKKCGLSYDEVRIRYEHFRARCLDQPTKQIKESKKPKKEKGCTNSFYGKKSKCIIQIVPKKSKKRSFKMSKACKIKKIQNGGF